MQTLPLRVGLSRRVLIPAALLVASVPSAYSVDDSSAQTNPGEASVPAGTRDENQSVPANSSAGDLPFRGEAEAATRAKRGTDFSFSSTIDVEDISSLMLETLFVTADGSQRVLVVTQTDLELRQANDLEDALSIDPSVTVGGSTSIAQKIYVRNLGEGLLNVSIDGATQAGFLFAHMGRILIEPDLIKQVEIQPGVGNASDGPGALGGAIRFITKDPGDLLRPGETAGAVVKQGYFSNTDGLKTSVTGFGRANDQWSGLLSVVYVDHDEMEDGDGDTLTGSDSQQQVVFGKVVGTFKNGRRLRLSYENLLEEGNKLRRPEWAPSPANPPFYIEAERRTGTVGYGIRPDTIEWVDLDFNLSYTRAEVMQDGPFGPYTGAIESIQFDARNTHRINDHKLVYGVDHRRDVVTAGPTSDPESFDEHATIAGVFFQSDIAITDQLTAHAGTRYDVFRLHDRAGQDFQHEGFSPNVGATYAFTPAFKVNAGVAAAYRGPHINDSFRIDLSNNDPDIEAEKAINYELRFLYEKSGLTLEVGGYVHHIDDVITNTLPWSTVYTNAGRVETEGVFARASYEIGDFVVGLQYNHANTSIGDQVATRYQYSSLLSRVGDVWVADILWRPIDQLDVGWNTRLVEGIDDILIPEAITGIPGPHYIDKPGYLTHDFYVRWRPTFAKALTVNLTVKNVFNEQYISHGSVEDLSGIPGFAGVVGAPEPGRDIRVSVSVRF